LPVGVKMTIANLRKEIRARTATATTAKVANEYIVTSELLATLAVAPPLEPILKIRPQNSVSIGEQPNFKIVTCNTCELFTPDEIGDGAGIGDCALGIKWTQEYNGRRPLFRYAERHCVQFSKLMD